MAMINHIITVILPVTPINPSKLRSCMANTDGSANRSGGTFIASIKEDPRNTALAINPNTNRFTVGPRR